MPRRGLGGAPRLFERRAFLSDQHLTVLNYLMNLYGIDGDEAFRRICLAAAKMSTVHLLGGKVEADGEPVPFGHYVEGGDPRHDLKLYLDADCYAVLTREMHNLRTSDMGVAVLWAIERGGALFVAWGLSEHVEVVRLVDGARYPCIGPW